MASRNLVLLSFYIGFESHSFGECSIQSPESSSDDSMVFRKENFSSSKEFPCNIHVAFQAPQGRGSELKVMSGNLAMRLENQGGEGSIKHGRKEAQDLQVINGIVNG